MQAAVSIKAKCRSMRSSFVASKSYEMDHFHRVAWFSRDLRTGRFDISVLRCYPYARLVISRNT